ncbi:hypothetical protein A5881_002948 [Enterococcus termitis]|nr:hypothetical protein A5881_002397 [Enterococcus termitis]
MNKPKYRAWDTWNKRMITEFGRETLVETSSGFHYVDLYAKTDGTVIASIKEHKNGDIFTNPVETLPLMQYTGLKDKNGVEIYEGDILRRKYKSINYSNVEHTIEYAVFRDNTGAWRVKNPNKTLTNVLEIRKAVEVIGNIHANPELLNEVD